jgi:hypothetical protein
MRGIVIAFLLLFSLSAQGQFIIDSYRFGGGADTLLLDDYAGAETAYSLRRLSTTYTGSAMLVRRSSDSDTLSIGFADNYLDTASMKTFCGTGATDTCFVRTWFDQSGNSRHATKTTNTAAEQPLIMLNGAIIYDGGDVGIRFTGATANGLIVPSSTSFFNFLHNGTNSAMAVVAKTTIGTTAQYIITNNNGGSAIGFYFAHFPTFSPQFASRSAAEVTVDNASSNNSITTAQFLTYMDIDADNATAAERNAMYINGGSAIKNNTSTGTPPTGNTSVNLALGQRTVGLFPLNGFIFEAIIWGNDQSTNRAAIETNINNFYSIY